MRMPTVTSDPLVFACACRNRTATRTRSSLSFSSSHTIDDEETGRQIQITTNRRNTEGCVGETPMPPRAALVDADCNECVHFSRDGSQGERRYVTRL